MPLFSRKKVSEYQKKLEKKLHVAQESRDEIFDISECQLTELPKGVEAQIKVFQKTALILFSNSLQHLCNPERSSDLCHLIYLDLHCNQFKHFPLEILVMISLQSLDLSQNYLKQLPNNIDRLKSLISLNVEGNQLKSLPNSLGNLSKLQELNVENNPIEQLPCSLGRLCKLKVFRFSMDSLTFPTKEICQGGIGSVLKFLQKASGIDDDSEEFANDFVDQTIESMVFQEPIDTNQYSREKRNEMLHRCIADEQRAQDRLIMQSNQCRSAALGRMAEEESKTKEDLAVLQQKQDARRKELLESLRDAEDIAAGLMQRLCQTNDETVQQKEADWEKNQLAVLEQDSNKFRGGLSKRSRGAILESMKATLLASQEAITKHQSLRDSAKNLMSSDLDHSDRALKQILFSRRSGQDELIKQIAVEEANQVAAFECLQRRRDLKRQRIVGEIQQVEEELCRLTRAEQERTKKLSNVNVRLLEVRRKDLLRLLTSLQQQKDKRDAELSDRLVEMEDRKSRDQTDYWLVQYQRLLDKKPSALLKQEAFVDDDVYKILADSGSSEYAANFEYHRITSDMMLTFTDEDLIKIGIHALGARNAILHVLEEYIAKRKLDYPEPSAPMEIEASAPAIVDKSCNDICVEKNKTLREEAWPSPVPSAPPLPPPTITARFESECCICQDMECGIIFLPCGHVCCCQKCSENVTACPLCRSLIDQRILLSMSYPQ